MTRNRTALAQTSGYNQTIYVECLKFREYTHSEIDGDVACETTKTKLSCPYKARACAPKSNFNYRIHHQGWGSWQSVWRVFRVALTKDECVELPTIMSVNRTVTLRRLHIAYIIIRLSIRTDLSYALNFYLNSENREVYWNLNLLSKFADYFLIIFQYSSNHLTLRRRI